MGIYTKDKRHPAEHRWIHERMTRKWQLARQKRQSSPSPEHNDDWLFGDDKSWEHGIDERDRFGSKRNTFHGFRWDNNNRGNTNAFGWGDGGNKRKDKTFHIDLVGSGKKKKDGFLWDWNGSSETKSTRPSTYYGLFPSLSLVFYLCMWRFEQRVA